YNPLIDDEVKQEWNVLANWKLIAQMPFGNPTATPGEKEFQPLEERVKFHK
ncbi:nitroreductase, partial [Bacillus toyonensis]